MQGCACLGRDSPPDPGRRRVVPATSKGCCGIGSGDGALPALLAMGGLFGLIVFGVLALWVKMDDKLIATVIAAVVLFTMARIGWSFFRA